MSRIRPKFYPGARVQAGSITGSITNFRWSDTYSRFEYLFKPDSTAPAMWLTGRQLSRISIAA